MKILEYLYEKIDIVYNVIVISAVYRERHITVSSPGSCYSNDNSLSSRNDYIISNEGVISYATGR